MPRMRHLGIGWLDEEINAAVAEVETWPEWLRDSSWLEDE